MGPVKAGRGLVGLVGTGGVTGVRKEVLEAVNGRIAQSLWV